MDVFHVPICVIDSHAAPAGDVPLSPSLLLSFYQGHVTVHRPEGASKPNTRQSTADSPTKVAKDMRYSVLLQCCILSEIKGGGS